MLNAHLSVLYCEDVRREIGNKFSYMGVLGPVVAMDSHRVSMDKVVVAVVMLLPKATAPTLKEFGVQVTQRNADGTEKVLQPMDPRPAAIDPAEAARIPADMPDDTLVQLVGLVVLRNLKFEQRCKLEVLVRTNEGESMGAPLQIVPLGAKTKEKPAKKAAKKAGRVARPAAKRR